MKGLMISLFVLMSLFMVSFVFAEISGSATTTFAYDLEGSLTEKLEESNSFDEGWGIWNTFSKALVVILVVIASYLIYKMRKKVMKSEKRNAGNTKKSKKVVKKKAKKVVKTKKK